MTAIAFGFACQGCIFLSLSLQRHYQQAWPGRGDFERRYRNIRISGYACVTAALVFCLLQSGLWIGLVLWLSMLAGAAFLQTMLLTWWPRRSLQFGGALVAIAGLLTWMQ